jgi:hypothetical protein
MPALHKGKVFLSNRTGPELIAQTGGGFRCLGEQQDPRSRSVEAVDQPDEHISGFAVFFAEVVSGEFQRGRVAGSIAGCEEARRLENGQTVVVLVEDLDCGGNSLAWVHGSRP